jgi:hypothetical protein
LAADLSLEHRISSKSFRAAVQETSAQRFVMRKLMRVTRPPTAARVDGSHEGCEDFLDRRLARCRADGGRSGYHGYGFQLDRDAP